MGILKTVSEDVRLLVLDGYSDKEISKATGFSLSVIKHIIDYHRKDLKINTNMFEDFNVLV